MTGGALYFCFCSFLTEYMSIEESLNKEKQETLAELERRTRVRLMNVSTDDDEVRKDLRILGEPVCYFGEGPADRRHRLKEVLSRYLVYLYFCLS